MRLSVIGAGYVGLVTGACFAELGNKVICVDNNKQKIADLKSGKMPFFEPGLEELLKNNVRQKRLSFTSELKEGIVCSDIIFIAVGTPSLANGEADLTGIENVARSVARYMQGYKLVVEKSTVPCETGEWVRKTISTYNRKNCAFDVASNPEFLREGSAVNDFMHPDRIVIGVETPRARDLLVRLYKPLNAPMVITDIKSAELIKHASNSYLATKISFINAISQVCDKIGADVKEVALGMGLDKRIGLSFLDAGLGYGGSCFPKDLDAFIHLCENAGYDFQLLKAVRRINQEQLLFVISKIKEHLWLLKDKCIAVWGISFKPNTDDIRNSPALELIRLLLHEGAQIRAFDPIAMKKAKIVLNEKGLVYCKSAYDAAKGADCIVLATQWKEFSELDFLKIKNLLKRPLLIDARNFFEPDKLLKLGFSYVGIGRKGC